MLITDLFRYRKTFFSIVLLLVNFTWQKATWANNPPIGYWVPVIINIYGNSITENKAKNAVDKANEILGQIGINFFLATNIQNPPAGNNGDDGSGGGTPGDGKFTAEEGWESKENNVVVFGNKELKKLPNEKGLKISFANDCWVEKPRTTGWSLGNNPTICIENHGNPAKLGQTIAHEFGHVRGLGHPKIDDVNDYEHNLMHPESGTHRTVIEEDQKRKILANPFWPWLDSIYDYAKCSEQLEKYYPALKKKLQYGRQADDRGDQANDSSKIKSTSNGENSEYDLGEIILTSVKDRDEIAGRLTVWGLLPHDEEINIIYAWGIDADNNLATGINYAGKEGIDKIVRAILRGNIALNTFIITGEILDTVLNSSISLPYPPIEVTDHIFFESDDEEGTDIPITTTVYFLIPKDLLNISVPEVPVVVSAGNDVSIFDTAEFIFDLERWLDDPTLETFGDGVPKPGSSYPFKVTGLKPNTSFKLFLDDMLVFSDTLDTTGSIEGEFIFPSNFSNREIHFLTGQDNTGEFAYNITCPDNYPWLVELDSFSLAPIQNNVLLEWRTGAELNNAGFRLWRGAIDENSELTDLIVFGEKLTKIKIGGDTSKVEACGLDLECIKDKLGNVDILEQGEEIKPRGSEREGAHYSYLDTSANHEGWTYYYLLEDLDTDGNRTFHWDFLKRAN